MDDVYKFAAMVEKAKQAQAIQFNRELDMGAIQIALNGGTEQDIANYVQQKLQEWRGSGWMGELRQFAGYPARPLSMAEQSLQQQYLAPKKPEQQVPIWYKDDSGDISQRYVPKSQASQVLDKLTSVGYQAGVGEVSPSVATKIKQDVSRETIESKFADDLKTVTAKLQEYYQQAGKFPDPEKIKLLQLELERRHPRKVSDIQRFFKSYLATDKSQTIPEDMAELLK